MAIFSLENEALVIQVNSHGAELVSVKGKKDEREYMWCGSSEYWGRVSPVLFPVVGAYKDKKSVYQGKTYEMGQHGFARDMEFSLAGKGDDYLSFVLKDTDETKQKYPFAFELSITYTLKDSQVEVTWSVHNPSKETMYFSIGGHPAFAAPKREQDKITCYIQLEGLQDILQVRPLKDGLADTAELTLPLEGGLLAVTEEVFAQDALIIENQQTGKVSLLDQNKKPYLTVDFDAPLFGLWTPPMKNAPFICIEPWYGRCDKIDFEGTLEEREWGNCLEAEGTFEKSYRIIVEN